MLNSKTILLTSFILIFNTNLFSKQIKGRVLDVVTNQPLIGANVIEQGTTNGTTTDELGNYILEITNKNSAIEVSYISYKNSIKNISLSKEGNLDFELEPDNQVIDQVTIQSRQIKNTDASLNNLQKKSNVVLDGISSAKFKKIGASNLGSALKQVSGVSMESGKYIYIRGLGDRYNAYLMNDAMIPSLDPNRNSLNLDLFPTGLIDNVLVYKTFNANLPGNFAGGILNITTKDFPESFEYSISASVGFNTQVHGKSDFLTHENNSSEIFGHNNGNRELNLDRNILPTEGQAINYDNKAQLLSEITKGLSNTFNTTTENKPFDYSLSGSIGNKYYVFNKELGVIAGFSYNNKKTFFNDGVFSDYFVTDRNAKFLSYKYIMNETRTTENILIGLMAKLSLKFNNNNYISFLANHNQNGRKLTQFLEGAGDTDSPDETLQRRRLEYNQRGISIFQLKGKNKLNFNNFQIDWVFSRGNSKEKTPDLKFFDNVYTFNLDKSRNYYIPTAAVTNPTRINREFKEILNFGRIDIKFDIKHSNAIKSTFKTGTMVYMKERDNKDNRFFYKIGTKSYDGNISNLIGNTWEKENNPNGVFIVSDYRKVNNHTVNENIFSYYLLDEISIKENFKAIVGFRAEKTINKYSGYINRNIEYNKQKIYDKTDYLPAINLTYDLSKYFKLRAGFSNTIARPILRERAPIAAFDNDKGFFFIGNPNLKRTLITNIDLRVEFNKENKDKFNVSPFYKIFENPIEYTQNPEATTQEIKPVNVPDASVFGLELEFSKNLEFISNFMRHFNLSSNITLIKSVVDIPEDNLQAIRNNIAPNAAATRQMFGQSPFLLNILFSYDNREKGIEANAVFNVQGERLMIVGDSQRPDVYEKPRPDLGINIKKQFDKLSIKLSANNILNSKKFMYQEFKGNEYTFRENRFGATYSISLNYRFSR